MSVEFVAGVPDCCCCYNVFLKPSNANLNRYDLNTSDPLDFNWAFRIKENTSLTPPAIVVPGTGFLNQSYALDFRNKRIFMSYQRSGTTNPIGFMQWVDFDYLETDPNKDDRNPMIEISDFRPSLMCVDNRHEKLFVLMVEHLPVNTQIPRIVKMNYDGSGLQTLYAFPSSVATYAVTSMHYGPQLDVVYLTYNQTVSSAPNARLGMISASLGGAPTDLITMTGESQFFSVDVNVHDAKLYWSYAGTLGSPNYNGGKLFSSTLLGGDQTELEATPAAGSILTRYLCRYSHKFRRLFFIKDDNAAPTTRYKLFHMHPLGGDIRMIFDTNFADPLWRRDMAATNASFLEMGCGTEVVGPDSLA